ncbi:hypothetical protein GGR50DRAFT_698559 [Xylaria sp. CBS 124048]|nr:hypothetical protein GGR50DRAFT_698559 [Xylaria sp. CBS 124048]
MPAILDDPSSPAIYRVSGALPYPDPKHPILPASIRPRHVTLRDRQTVATVVPFVSRDHVPSSLLRYLSDQLAKEIEGGDTYPMVDPMPFETFASYWFQNFAGIILLGQVNRPEEVVEGRLWSQDCLGSFYIKPNYPGRSSHVCNAGFLVTDAARNRGVGRLMGEAYLDWAPKIGYTYSVFNLVYETNVASCKLWDGLGFKRIGRVKGCGNLKSYPGRLVDAIIYGRDLGVDVSEGGDPLLVSEERFDRIKFYLKYGRYPNGSDRAEKSRLRSAATHYKLLDNDVLMLKGKEVISDPIRQMAVARKTHGEGGHAGINKTTSVIAEKYHWSRIKETVSDVIRTCDQCKDLGKNPSSAQSQSQNQNQNQNQNQSHQTLNQDQRESTTHQSRVGNNMTRRFHDVNETRAISGSTPGDLMATSQTSPIHEHAGMEASRMLDLHQSVHDPPLHHELTSHLVTNPNPYAHPSDITSLLNPPFQTPSSPVHHFILHGGAHHATAAATLASLHDTEMYSPIDPQIISRPVNSHSHPHHHQQPPPDAFGAFHSRFPMSPHHHHPEHNHATSPPMTHSSSVSVSAHDLEYGQHVGHSTLSSHAIHDVSTGHDGPPHDDITTNSFQALLNDQDPDSAIAEHMHAQAQAQTHNRHQPHHNQVHNNLLRAHQHHHNPHAHTVLNTPQNQQDQDQDAVDRDMAMLIDHHDSASPSPDPCVSTTSSIRVDVDMDLVEGLDLDTPPKSSSNNDADRSNGGNSKGKYPGSRTRPTSPEGDASAAGAKRSDIYNVVFDVP